MTTPAQRPKSFMHVFGGIILACVALYYIFIAADSVGLKTQSSVAQVIGKEIREPRKTYFTQPVGGLMLVRMQHYPELYLLELEVAGERAFVAVDQDLYENIGAEDEVEVKYRRGRLLGRLQVDDVRQ